MFFSSNKQVFGKNFNVSKIISRFWLIEKIMQDICIIRKFIFQNK